MKIQHIKVRWWGNNVTFIIFTCTFMHMTDCAMFLFFCFSDVDQSYTSAICDCRTLRQNWSTMLWNKTPCWVWDQVHSNISAHKLRWFLWLQSQVYSRCKQPFWRQLIKSNIQYMIMLQQSATSFTAYCLSCCWMNRWMRSESWVELAYSTSVVSVGLWPCLASGVQPNIHLDALLSCMTRLIWPAETVDHKTCCRSLSVPLFRSETEMDSLHKYNLAIFTLPWGSMHSGAQEWVCPQGLGI